MKLIKLEKISSIKKMWPNEEYDFTPWLAENLQELGDVIGYDLECEEIEKPVGPYSADIVAKDKNDEKRIVIENQYGKTNHDHLGKCITYASVLNAKVIVWITEKFSDEHKKAMEWLNENTSLNLEFYGIELSLLKVNDSEATLNWDVVIAPNELVKENGGNTPKITTTGQKQLKFWTDFRNAISDYIKHPQKASAAYWFDIPLGKSGIHLSNTYNTNTNTIGCRLYIHGDTDYMLPYLEKRKKEIEDKLGLNLVWNPNPNNKDKVVVYSKDFNMDDDAEYAKAVAWLKENTIKMHKVFSSIIKEYK